MRPERARIAVALLWLRRPLESHLLVLLLLPTWITYHRVYYPAPPRLREAPRAGFSPVEAACVAGSKLKKKLKKVGIRHPEGDTYYW